MGMPTSMGILPPTTPEHGGPPPPPSLGSLGHALMTRPDLRQQPPHPLLPQLRPPFHHPASTRLPWPHLESLPPPTSLTLLWPPSTQCWPLSQPTVRASQTCPLTTPPC